MTWFIGGCGKHILAVAHSNTMGTVSNLLCLFTDRNDFLPRIPWHCLVWSSPAKHTGCAPWAIRQCQVLS